MVRLRFLSGSVLTTVAGRICKHLAAMEDLVEVDEDLYRLTDYTASLRLSSRNSIVGHKYGLVDPVLHHPADAW